MKCGQGMSFSKDGNCPACNSPNLARAPIENDSEHAREKIKCGHCGQAYWREWE